MNIKICKNPKCNKEFKSFISSNKKYCSDLCRKQNFKKYFCECGKEITKNTKHCQECYGKSIAGENHYNYKHGKTRNNICIDCGKHITFYGVRCHSCAEKQRIGKLAPGYIHGKGYESYPVEFNDELREIIRKRDNYTCQNCSMTEGEHLIVRERILDIHHIDGNKENNNKENLITLCNSCNVRANFNKEHWQEFYTNLIRNKINRGVDVVLYQNNVNNKGNSKKNLYASLLN
jgi:5-methylcytosine-specific restriction endonuclease McrA